MKIIDLSYTLDDNCMTCGTSWHINVKIRQLGKIADVGRNTCSITLGSHSGTHIDAPLHFYDGGNGIDKIDLQEVCGECSVIDMTRKKNGDKVEYSDVKNLIVSKRMLFRFDWFKNWQSDIFYKEFPYFSIDAATHLVKRGLKVIALDTPSPDTASAIEDIDDSPVHKIFLKNGITIIEYLTNTDKLDNNKKNILMALPLKLKDCDGSPARVVMMEI